MYFTAGSEQLNYIAKSLFDPESQENSGQKRMYNVSWDYHLASVTGLTIHFFFFPILSIYVPYKIVSIIIIKID